MHEEPDGRTHVRRPGRLSRVVSWGTLALLGALTAGAAWLGTAGSPPSVAAPNPAAACSAPATGFSGYVEQRPADRVSAEWTVPATGKSYGFAATWVGLQWQRKAFIQVGTNENHSAQPRYEAFWSDTALGFHPHTLLSVRPGDAVRASISKVAGGWSVRFDDLTANRANGFVTPYASSTRMNLAEWIQEDPSTGCTDFAYPQTSTVTFGQLSLDGADPVLPYADAQILESPNGIVLVPTHVTDDGFSVAEPTGVQAQYLDDTSPFNTAEERFVNGVKEDARARRAPGPTAAFYRSESEASAEQFLDREKALQRDLDTQRWPPDAERYARELAAVNGRLVVTLTAAIARFERDGTWTIRGWGVVNHTIAPAADGLRQALGLPPTVPRALRGSFRR